MTRVPVGAALRHPYTRLGRDGLVLIAFAVLTAVLTNPLVLHLASAVEDKQDALLNTWIIAWVGHALVTDPVHLFNANIFYPYPNTLAFSEVLLPQGLLALPVNLAAGNTILGYNLVLLFSFLLAAYAMYLFVFDLTHHRGAAVVAGTIFAFNPYNLSNLAQVQLLSLGWLPLALVFLQRLLRADARLLERDGTRNILLFALFFSIQSLASIYYAFLSGIAVALYVVWFLLFSGFTHRAASLVRLALSAMLIALFVIPFLLPYFQVQSAQGFQRKVEESEPFSANVKLYTEVSPHNLLYGNLLAPHPPVMIGGYPLDNLFPGVLALALAVLGMAAAKHRDKWYYILLLACAFVLSFGPRLFIAPSLGTSVTLPYRWLYDAIPFTHALRAPVRFDALVMFALAVLAALGVRQLTTSPRLGSFAAPVAMVICLCISLEYLALPAANITPVPTGDTIPAYVHWLAQQPPTTILELPMLARDPTKPLDLTTQYLSTYHWQTTPDGYSGFSPSRRGELADAIERFFPGGDGQALLQALDVRYVILHAGPEADDWREATWVYPDLTLFQRFGDTLVYRLQPRPPDGSGIRPQVYLPSPAPPNSGYTGYLVLNYAPSAATRLASGPTDTLQITAHWTDGTTQQVTAPLPFLAHDGTVIPFHLQTPGAGATASRLDLRITGRGIGEWTLNGQVSIGGVEAARQVVLPISATARVSRSYAPGERLTLPLVWSAYGKIDAYYSASLRVVDEHGNKVAQDDHAPNGTTFLWEPRTSIEDEFSITLPLNLAPGEYTIQLKMYQADLGIDALLLDQEHTPRETLTLGAFTIK